MNPKQVREALRKGARCVVTRPHEGNAWDIVGITYEYCPVYRKQVPMFLDELGLLHHGIQDRNYISIFKEAFA